MLRHCGYKRTVIETRTVTKIYKANATPITAIEEILFAAEDGKFRVAGRPEWLW
jgi:hypothetical protein